MDTQYTLEQLQDMIAATCLSKKEIAQRLNYSHSYFCSVLRGVFPLTEIFARRVVAACRQPNRIVNIEEAILAEKLDALAKERRMTVDEIANFILRRKAESMQS